MTRDLVGHKVNLKMVQENPLYHIYCRTLILLFIIIIIYDQGPGGTQGEPEDGPGESALSHLGGPNPKTRCHFLLSLINRLVLLKNVVFFCEHGTKDLLRFVYLFYILICYRYIRACKVQ